MRGFLNHFLMLDYILIIICLFLYQPNYFSQNQLNSKNDKLPINIWKPYTKSLNLSEKEIVENSTEDADIVLDKKNFHIKRRVVKQTLQKLKQEKFLDNDWQRLDGPQGGSVRRFYTINDTIYAITDRDVFQLQDQKWISIYNNPNSINLNLCMYKSQTNIIIVGTDKGLCYSSDSGESWHNVQNDLNFIAISDIVESPDGKILIATSNGIYSSLDNANQFTQFSLPNINTNTITFDKVGNIWAGTSDGVYKAKYDSNLTWQKMDLEKNYYKKIIFDSKGVAYTYNNNYVFRSTDNGLSWEYLGGGWINDIMVDNNDKLIITGTYNIYITSENGIDTMSIASNIFLLNTFLTNRNELLVGTLGAGALAYNRLANTFNDFSNGMNASTIRAILSMGNGEIIVSTDANACYITGDNGFTWKKVLNYRTLILKKGIGNTIYAAVKGGISKSIDFGRTWEPLNIDVLPYFVSAFDFSDDNTTICAGTSTGELYTSYDGGRNFKKVKDANYIFVDAIKYINSNSFIISNDQMYFTNDASNALLPLGNVIQGRINDIILDNNRNIYIASSNGLFKSNNGLNWSKISSIQSGYLMTDEFNNLYSITGNGVVNVSYDFGRTWEAISDPIGPYFLWSSGISKNGYIFEGTQDHGIYRKKIEIKELEISDNSISQNFPNPFNSETVIHYRLQQNSLVTIKIYDLLGREVTTLVNEAKNKGRYEVNLNGKNLASGIYFYRITTNNYSEVKKMVLLK